jgi:methylenetetrahydrofolate dehydrogenase (NADP+)/methenyltetrahydrofolate cyclohydrolase
MAAKVLDGIRISAAIKAELAEEVQQLRATGLLPGLAAVLVGHNPASEVYVRNKVRTCAQVGLYSEMITPSADISTDALLDVIHELNRRDDIDGILVQLPLPKQIDAKRILLAVDPAKDVDGFHPTNVGLLSTMRPGLVPCTPAGCMEILQRSDIKVEGMEAVVVGRSDIVGKPIAMLLTNAHASVMICHSRTRNLAEVCRRADILIAAIGMPGIITPDMVRPGATVIDVGINRIDDRATFDQFFAGDSAREKQFVEKGTTLVGDVHPRVAEVAGALTPVPGGVGPLTIAMLMSNTVKAAKMRRGAAKEIKLQTSPA